MWGCSWSDTLSSEWWRQMFLSVLKSLVHEESDFLRLCFILSACSLWCRVPSAAAPVSHSVCFLLRWNPLETLNLLHCRPPASISPTGWSRMASGGHSWTLVAFSGHMTEAHAQQSCVWLGSSDCLNSCFRYSQCRPALVSPLILASHFDQCIDLHHVIFKAFKLLCRRCL